MERESTRTLAIDHPGLALAVDFVATHFQSPVGVDQIVAVCGQSRRWLEEAFRRELDCSPGEFLKRMSVRAAREILSARPKIGLGELAALCGFSGTRQLKAVFERETGSGIKVSVNHPVEFKSL